MHINQKQYNGLMELRVTRSRKAQLQPQMPDPDQAWIPEAQEQNDVSTAIRRGRPKVSKISQQIQKRISGNSVTLLTFLGNYVHDVTNLLTQTDGKKIQTFSTFKIYDKFCVDGNYKEMPEQSKSCCEKIRSMLKVAMITMPVLVFDQFLKFFSGIAAKLTKSELQEVKAYAQQEVFGNPLICFSNDKLESIGYVLPQGSKAKLKQLVIQFATTLTQIISNEIQDQWDQKLYTRQYQKSLKNRDKTKWRERQPETKGKRKSKPVEEASEGMNPTKKNKID